MRTLLLSAWLLGYLPVFAQSKSIKVSNYLYPNGTLWQRTAPHPYTTQYKEASMQTHWYENGQKRSEELIISFGNRRYLNCWTGNGTQIGKNGNGLFLYKGYEPKDDSTVYTLKDSLLQGPFTTFTPTATGYRKIATGFYRNNVMHGEVAYYSETGQVAYTNTYIDDFQKGLCKEFYPDGKLKAKGLQVEDIKQGRWTIYNEQGILTQHETYVNGVVIHLTTYHSNGKIKEKGGYTTISTLGDIDMAEYMVTTGGRRRLYGTLSTVKHGVWLTYNKAGHVVKKETYHKGELVKK
jgi:antitoxin component YwqK of YwqJK toxin-antitoxin module